MEYIRVKGNGHMGRWEIYEVRPGAQTCTRGEGVKGGKGWGKGYWLLEEM